MKGGSSQERRSTRARVARLSDDLSEDLVASASDTPEIIREKIARLEIALSSRTYRAESVAYRMIEGSIKKLRQAAAKKEAERAKRQMATKASDDEILASLQADDLPTMDAEMRASMVGFREAPPELSLVDLGNTTSDGSGRSSRRSTASPGSGVSERDLTGIDLPMAEGMSVSPDGSGSAAGEGAAAERMSLSSSGSSVGSRLSLSDMERFGLPPMEAAPPIRSFNLVYGGIELDIPYREDEGSSSIKDTIIEDFNLDDRNFVIREQSTGVVVPINNSIGPGPYILEYPHSPVGTPP